MENFDDFSGEKHIIEQVYDDGFKPAISEMGKTATMIPQTINAVLLPLRKWILAREYNLKEVQKLLEQKLSKVGGGTYCYARSLCCSSSHTGAFILNG